MKINIFLLIAFICLVFAFFASWGSYTKDKNYVTTVLAYEKAMEKEATVSAAHIWGPLATPSPTPAPLPPSVEDIIETVFADLGQSVVKQAKLVAQCESGLNKTAANTHKNKDTSRDDGVFQINSVHKVNERFLHDAWVNVSIARKLYEEQKWEPWRSSNKCHKLLDNGK